MTNVFMTNISMTSVFMTSEFMTKITEPASFLLLKLPVFVTFCVKYINACKLS